MSEVEIIGCSYRVTSTLLTIETVEALDGRVIVRNKGEVYLNLWQGYLSTFLLLLKSESLLITQYRALYSVPADAYESTGPQMPLEAQDS